MLYAAIKTGISVSLQDLGLNVLLDLLNYSAEIDKAVIDGKNIRKSKPMSVADMTMNKRVRG